MKQFSLHKIGVCCKHDSGIVAWSWTACILTLQLDPAVALCTAEQVQLQGAGAINQRSNAPF
jgi:hypothetical protein